MSLHEDTSPPAAEAPLPLAAVTGVGGGGPSQAALPAIIGGKYRPLRLIARGGMGAVYEVRHANTGEHLALKLMLSRSLLSPELVERFRREARVSSSVRDEHVVRVVDADVAPELDDAPFIVMELLAGQDFERTCDRRAPSAAEVVEWMGQLGHALDKAHAEGIVHRDLKPENVFLAERPGAPPIVKILDFGVAKMDDEAAGMSTATGQILGTPRYMAPEQAAGAKGASPASDRFALGLITFRLLCGRHYFAGESWIALLSEVARGPSKRPSELGCDRGRAFDEWFARACAVEPRARFGSCAEQAAALALALDGRAARPRRRRAARLLVPVGATAALAFALGLAGWSRSRPASPPPTSTPALATASPPRPAPAAAPPVAPRPLEAVAPATIEGPRREAAPHLAPPRGAPLRAHKPRVAPTARDRIWDEP